MRATDSTDVHLNIHMNVYYNMEIYGRELESSRESYLWALGRLNTFRLSACSRYLDRLFHVQLFSFRFPLPSRLVFLHGAPPKIQPQPTLCGQLPFSYGGSSAAR